MTLAGQAIGPRVRAMAGELSRGRPLATLRAWQLPLALAAALCVWLSLLALLQPLTPDEAAYKIVATGALHGQWPYRDLFDHKPPLAYAWYLPSALGAGMIWERVPAALCIAASIPVFAVVARRWLPASHARIATVGYAALLANPGLSVRGNLEAFALLPLVGAFAVTSPFAAGVLLGIAAMTKPMALVFAPVLVVLWRRDAWKAAAGALLVGALVSLPFIPIWRDYWTANVTFNLEYGSMPLGERLRTLVTVPSSVFIGWLPLWILLAIAAVRVRERRAWLLALCGVASVKLSGQQFSHYYALLAPGAAMLAASGVVWMWQRGIARAALVGVTLLSLLPVVFGLPHLIRTYDEIHHPLAAAQGAIDATPGELYVLGDQPQAYVEAGRRPQRRFFFIAPAVVRPDWGAQLREELIACPPPVLVDAGGGVFDVAWRGEITALYGRSIRTEAGMVYLDPRAACAPATNP